MTKTLLCILLAFTFVNFSLQSPMTTEEVARSFFSAVQENVTAAFEKYAPNAEYLGKGKMANSSVVLPLIAKSQAYFRANCSAPNGTAPLIYDRVIHNTWWYVCSWGVLGGETTFVVENGLITTVVSESMPFIHRNTTEEMAELWEQQKEAWLSMNVTATMEAYTEESILFYNTQPLSGLAAIRTFWTNSYAFMREHQCEVNQTQTQTYRYENVLFARSLVPCADGNGGSGNVVVMKDGKIRAFAMFSEYKELTETQQTERVLRQLKQAYEKGDEEEVLSYYSENLTSFSEGKVYRGRQALRDSFALMRKYQCQVKSYDAVVSGNAASYKTFVVCENSYSWTEGLATLANGQVQTTYSTISWDLLDNANETAATLQRFGEAYDQKNWTAFAETLNEWVVLVFNGTTVVRGREEVTKLMKTYYEGKSCSRSSGSSMVEDHLSFTSFTCEKNGKVYYGSLAFKVWKGEVLNIFETVYETDAQRNNMDSLMKLAKDFLKGQN